MRVQIDLDSQVMKIVRDLAAERDQSMGKVLSDLLREVLVPAAPTEFRNGFPLFRRSNRGDVVSNEHINRIKNGESEN